MASKFSCCFQGVPLASRFLLPTLHLQTLGHQPLIRDVKEELLRLPTKRYEIYRIAIARIQEQSQDSKNLGMRILAWVVHSWLPMTVPQLQHAIATRPGDKQFDKEGIIAAEELINHTAGLLTIQNDEVHCVHHTVEEFLREPERERDCFAGAREEMAPTCHTYLHFDDLKYYGDDFQQVPLDYPLFEYAAIQWGYFEPEPEFQGMLQALTPLLQHLLIYLRNKFYCNMNSG